MAPGVSNKKKTRGILKKSKYTPLRNESPPRSPSVETTRYLEHAQQELTNLLEASKDIKWSACVALLALGGMSIYPLFNCLSPGMAPAVDNNTMWPVAGIRIADFETQDTTPGSAPSLALTLPAESNRPIRKEVERLLVLTGRRPSPVSLPMQGTASPTPAGAQDDGPTPADETPNSRDGVLPYSDETWYFLCHFSIGVICVTVLFLLAFGMRVVWLRRNAHKTRQRLTVARRLMRALASGTGDLPEHEVRRAVEEGDMGAADKLVARCSRTYQGPSMSAAAASYYGAISSV